MEQFEYLKVGSDIFEDVNVEKEILKGETSFKYLDVTKNIEDNK